MIISCLRCDEILFIRFNVKIVLLLLWVSGFVFSGKLLVFDVIGRKVCEIVGDR